MDSEGKEILRTIYYFAQADPTCFTKRRLQATRQHLQGLEFNPQRVKVLVTMYLAGTIDFALVLQARYLWIKKVLALGPCIAIYWTTRGPVFGVFSSKHIIKRFKHCGPLTDLSCTPNLVKPLDDQFALTINTLLKRFDIGFTVEELAKKVAEAT
jgi:hypothetical protein